MNRKLLYGLFAATACFTLVGCGDQGEQNSATGGIDLNKENVLSCTNISRHVAFQNNDVVESWKYVIEYADNNKDILNWKEVYTGDFSKIENTTHEEIVELIDSRFCKGRLNDVTEEGYEANKELCKITNKDKVYTAVVTYPEKSIKHFTENSEESFDKASMKKQLEDGTYDGGFRGIYTCDKTFDHFTITPQDIERDVQIKYTGDYQYGKEEALDLVAMLLEKGSSSTLFQYPFSKWLKEYKVDGNNNLKATLKSEDGNDKYTFTVKLTCYSNNKQDCEKYMDAIYAEIAKNQNSNTFTLVK